MDLVFSGELALLIVPLCSFFQCFSSINDFSSRTFRVVKESVPMLPQVQAHINYFFDKTGCPPLRRVMWWEWVYGLIRIVHRHFDVAEPGYSAFEKLFQPVCFCSSSASHIPHSSSSQGTSRWCGNTSFSSIQFLTARSKMCCNVCCIFFFPNHLCRESQHLSVICALRRTLHFKKCWAVSTHPQFNGHLLTSLSSPSSWVAWLALNLCFCCPVFCQSKTYLIALMRLWICRPFMAYPNAFQCTNLNVSTVQLVRTHVHQVEIGTNGGSDS